MRITSDITNVTAGSNLTLQCVIEGLNDLDPTIIYQWNHFNGNELQIVGDNSKTMFFSHLRLSDAGEYTRTIDVSSLLLDSDIHIQSSIYKVMIESKYACSPPLRN